jgi:hypothetical protein
MPEMLQEFHQYGPQSTILHEHHLQTYDDVHKFVMEILQEFHQYGPQSTILCVHHSQTYDDVHKFVM